MSTLVQLSKVLALAAALAGVSSAQIPVGGGDGGSFGSGPLTCLANVPNPTAARVEGVAELLGDIVIMCTGGVAPAAGSPVPTVNITVALSNTTVTSRVFGNGLSEALLLIDEPGLVGYGPTLPQTLCTGAALGAGTGGCETYANLAPGQSIASICTALSGGACTSFGATPNVFQGVVNGNQVTFNGIPVLAPVTAGYARFFRITNIRADASVVGTGESSGTQPILGSLSISSLLTLTNPIMTTAFVFNGFDSTEVRNAANSAVGTGINVTCGSAGLTPGAVLRFTEGFANAFRSRVGGGQSYSAAGTAPGSKQVLASFPQNVPGGIYPGAESAFIFDTGSGLAGLADFGTRLKATFYNVPAGVNLYVSTTNINPLGNLGVNPSTGANLGAGAAAVAAGNFGPVSGVISLLAGLVTSQNATAAPGSFLPLVAGTHNSGGVNLFGPLPVDANGTATAVWEILLNKWQTPEQESADFAVFYTLNGAPPRSPVSTVALSLAPTSGAGSLIPRFTPASTASTMINVGACQATPAVTLTASPNPSTYKQAVTLRATVAAVALAVGTPGGSVTFRDGATTLSTVTLASGQAAYSTSALVAGTHLITAAYGGDGIFPPATSAALSQVVNRAATATSVNIGAGSANVGETTVFSASVTSSAGTPTGTVTFRDGGAPIGTAPLDTGGGARVPFGAQRIGYHEISAVYNGDANFLDSVSAGQGFSVNALPTSVSTPVLRSGNPGPGQALTFAASVTSGGAPVVLGGLSFRDANIPLGTVGLDAAGTGVITLSSLAAGNHVITANFERQGQYSAANSDPLFLTIRGATTMTVTSSPNPSDNSGAVTLTAKVAAMAGSAVPTGTVTFTEGSTALGNAALNASGQATLAVPAGFTAGDHNILASYGGDANFTGASASLVQHVVQRVLLAPTTTTLREGEDAGGIWLTAEVRAAGGGTPGGSAQFRDLATGGAIGSAALVNGTAKLALAGTLPVGHKVQATYPGDSAFTESASEPLTFLAAANAFSFANGFAPDAVVSVFGAGLSASSEAAPAGQPGTTLGAITVAILDGAGNSYAAALYYVSPRQINLVIPADVPPGPAKLRIAAPDGPLEISIVITRLAPGLATADGSGSGVAAAQLIRVHRDGAQEPPVPAASSPAPSSVAPGDRVFLVLYGTGLRHAAEVSCSLNGQPTALLYSGPHSVYAGLDQINLEVPGDLRGAIVVNCAGDGQTSNNVRVSVE